MYSIVIIHYIVLLLLLSLSLFALFFLFCIVNMLFNYSASQPQM